MTRFFLIPLLSLLGVGIAQADLNFEAETLERTISVVEGKVPVTFRFTNTTARKVKVSRIETTCGCLKASADKKFYDPGESGQVDVVFTTPGEVGKYQKSVVMVTNLKDQEEIKLTLVITATPIITIEPKMVKWEVGESATPKKVVLKVMDGVAPIHVKEVSTSRSSFSAQLVTVEDGKQYEVVLTPEDTSAKTLGALRIETDCDVNSQKKQMAFFRVGD